jgi:hypothetical protein
MIPWLTATALLFLIIVLTMGGLMYSAAFAVVLVNTISEFIKSIFKL